MKKASAWIGFCLMLAVALLSGCASTTLPGQIGASRSQLLIVPAARLDAMASEAYAKQTSAARNAGRLNNDDAMTTRVKVIAGRLIDQVGVYRPDARDWNWQVNVIDSNELNAYCMPGGRIAVYSGLIRRLDLNDAEIAGVVGHEIAHALREHSREKASQQVLGNAVVQSIANSGSRNASSAAMLADLGAKLFLHLPFSRDMELEADSMGLELAARAGFDPVAAMGIWRKMQRAEGAGSTPEFLRTHPTHDRRIAESEVIARKVSSLYQPRSGGETMRQSVQGRQSYGSTSASASVDGCTASIALYTDADICRRYWERSSPECDGKIESEMQTRNLALQPRETCGQPNSTPAAQQTPSQAMAQNETPTSAKCSASVNLYTVQDLCKRYWGRLSPECDSRIESEMKSRRLTLQPLSMCGKAN